MTVFGLLGGMRGLHALAPKVPAWPNTNRMVSARPANLNAKPHLETPRSPPCAGGNVVTTATVRASLEADKGRGCSSY